MAHFTLGKLKFEHRNTGTVESAEDTVAIYSCHPPPAGRRQRFNPQLNYAPHQPASHMQAEERRRIETFGANQGETLTLATVIGEIKTNFKINPLTIDLSTIPQNWRRPEPCFDLTIAVVVSSVLLRVDVTATQDVSLDGVTWPEGDSVAQFRIVVPDQYRFIRHRVWNPDCCPWPDPNSQPPRFDPEKGDWSAHNFVEYSYLEYDWTPSLGMEFEFGYPYHKWYGKIEYLIPLEDPTGEEHPEQPWILPHPGFKSKDKKK